MHSIIVAGGGGNAKVLISIIKKLGHKLVGYTDKRDRDSILGVPYLGNDRVLETDYRKYRICRVIVGVGKIDTSELRLDLQSWIESLGYKCPAMISPDAVVNEDVQVGAGTTVGDGVVINSGTKIGKASLLNTNCTVEHDCRLGDNVHIAPGVVLSGGVTIGHHSMIGTGVNVIQSVRINDSCLIGAGATVVSDLMEPGLYLGSPARKAR